MKYRFVYIIFIIFFIGCSQNRNTNEKGVLVFCASSLTDVISEITFEFEKQNQIQIQLNLASSGALARQIENGANPDIFISADKKWTEYLNQEGLTITGTEKKIAGNSLVLVAPVKSNLDKIPFSLSMNLPEIFKGRLSIGDPKHVPAGQYAVQLLEKLGCAKELESRFLPAKDVRSALMVVELGEVEAGIVYKTDALKSTKVKIVTEFPDSLYGPVYYYMSLIHSQNNGNSKKLYNYITSQKATYIWKKYGFIL